MSSGVPVFTVGPPPHWRSKSSITQQNYAFILALLPTALVGVIAVGVGARGLPAPFLGESILGEALKLIIRELGLQPWFLAMVGAGGVIALALGTAIVVEYGIQILFRQPYYVMNGHGALMGLIIGLLMPPTVPWWVVVITVTVAILVGKQMYGGIGGYPFHPAMVGFLIALVSWRHHLYPVGMNSIAAQHQAAILVTFAGGLALVALGHLRWQFPAALLLGVAVFGAIFNYAYPAHLPGEWYQDALQEMMTGHVMLAAFFIVGDSTSSPANVIPMWIYGIGAGFMIMLIRVYGVWPDAVPFAVLLMNLLNPVLDRIQPAVKEVTIQHG